MLTVDGLVKTAIDEAGSDDFGYWAEDHYQLRQPH